MTKIWLLIMNLMLQERDFVIKYFTIKFSLQNYFLSLKFLLLPYDRKFCYEEIHVISYMLFIKIKLIIKSNIYIYIYIYFMMKRCH